MSIQHWMKRVLSCFLPWQSSSSSIRVGSCFAWSMKKKESERKGLERKWAGIKIYTYQAWALWQRSSANPRPPLDPMSFCIVWEGFRGMERWRRLGMVAGHQTE